MRRSGKVGKARRVSVAALAVAAALLAFADGGCEAIVPGSVEAFRCASMLASACPSGQTCATATGQCVPASQACTLAGCTPPEVCDPGSQQCMMSIPGTDASPPVDSTPPPIDSMPFRKDSALDTSVSPPVDSKAPPPDVAADASCGVGCDCSTTAACTKGMFCASGSVIDVLNDASICTMPCCATSDCPADSVCYATGKPGSYCVPVSFLPLEGTGTGSPGDPCSLGSSCRSGLCDTTGRCLDTCCPSTNCGSGATCAIDDSPPTGFHQGPYCLTNTGNDPPGATCNDPSTCSSELCVMGTVDNFCSTPCCSSQACSSGDGNSCQPVGIEGSNDELTGCAGPNEPGGSFGSSCESGADCASSVCDPSSGSCTEVCCIDADCASDGHPSLVCRPMTSSPFSLICTKGP